MVTKLKKGTQVCANTLSAASWLSALAFHSRSCCWCQPETSHLFEDIYPTCNKLYGKFIHPNTLLKIKNTFSLLAKHGLS